MPANFKYRALDDLGCGDGKVTLLLKQVFSPSRVRGFDINPSLVKRAKERGIEAEVKNLERELPQGELAVVWGVLHHLREKENFLKRLKEGYKFIFIREPVKNHHFHGFELGRPLTQEEIKHLRERHLPSSKLVHFEDNILIFYQATKGA